jgi:hypothetical protein
MLHRTIAESPLWKEEDSRGEAAGQSREGRGGPRRAGTWPGAVFGAAQRPPAGCEDLPGSLRPACYLDGAAVAAAVAELPSGPAPQAPEKPKGAARLPWHLAPLREMDSRHADAIHTI